MRQGSVENPTIRPSDFWSKCSSGHYHHDDDEDDDDKDDDDDEGHDDEKNQYNQDPSQL